jgi:FAD/FMN-containing dehydrogenase
VVRFHLRIYPAPGHIANTVLRFPFAMAEEVFEWAHAIGPSVASEVELNVIVHRGDSGDPEITVIAPTLADSAEKASAALAFMTDCPLRERAMEVVPVIELALSDLYDAVGAFYPEGARYAVDNMWTHAEASDLLPGIAEIAATLPPAPSGMLWLNWGGASSPRPPMAFSVEDQTYIAVYGVWSDAADDERNVRWPEERMRAMEPHASGVQLADENLGRRPARFITEENMARLGEIRDRYDPSGRFHAWMGQPARG